MPGILSTTMTKTEIQFTDGSQQSSSANPIYRNRVINSRMRVAQRGPVAVPLNTLTFGGCDRFPVKATGFTTFSGTLQRAGSSGFYVQELANVTTTGSGTISFIHRMERRNVTDLYNCFVTLQAELYQDTGATITATLSLNAPSGGINGNDDWSYTAPYTFATQTVSIPSGVRTKVVWTYDIDQTSVPNDYRKNRWGLGFIIDLPVGAVTGKYFQISNCQFEKGSYPTEIEYVPLTIEEMRCQRYYCELILSDGKYAAGTQDISGPAFWPQPMRVAPTVAVTNGQLSNSSGVEISAINKYGARHYVYSVTTGQCTSTGTIVKASAELI